MSVGLVMGVGTLGVLSWAEQAHTQAIAHTMGVVTFSLYALSFSTARQWLICLAVALSIVLVSEIRKAVQRHATLDQSSRPLGG